MEFRTRIVPFLLLAALLGTDAALVKRPDIYNLHITSDIRFRFATTLVTSRVRNMDTVAREALFNVTLPNEAFISNFTLEVDGKIIQGVVKEKEQAQAEYTAAVKRGETAGIVGTRERETNKFNLRVSVAPQSKVTFNLTYEELLKRQLGRYEQVIYIDPGQPVEEMSVKVSIIESRDITELTVPPLRNDLFIDEKEPFSQALVARTSNRSAVIIFQPSMDDQTALSEQGLATKFRIRYDVDREQNAGELLVVNGYFVHFFAPSGYDPIPKDVLFMLDTSGSMYGRKLEQLKEAMDSILQQLHEVDRFSLATFSDYVTFWQHSLQQGGEENIDVARKYVNGLRSSGSTNIDLALERGVKFLTNTTGNNGTNFRAPVLIFLTDGEATTGEINSEAILKNVRRINTEDVTIVSLAFGRNADYDLVKKIAIDNNGVGRKIYEASDAAMQITGFFDEISQTLLKNVTFKYLDSPVSNVTKSEFNNYFEGSEMVVCGQLPQDDDLGGEESENTPLDHSDLLTLRISSQSARGPIVLELSEAVDQFGILDNDNETNTKDFERITEKIWAYLTIKQLLERELVENDPEEKKTLHQRALRLSLLYKFVTPLTSMVVTNPTTEVEEIAPVLDEEEESAPAITRGRSQSYTNGYMAHGRPMNHLRPFLPIGGLGGLARYNAPPPVGMMYDLSAGIDYDYQPTSRTRSRKRKGKKRRKNRLSKTVNIPLVVGIRTPTLELFCFDLLTDRPSNTRTNWYLLYAGTSDEVQLSAEITQPKLTDTEQVATMSALNITTGNQTVTIRHHLVDGGDSCSSNWPWGRHWFLACSDGLEIHCANDVLTVKKELMELEVQYVTTSTSGNPQLRVTTDLIWVQQGNAGILTDLSKQQLRAKKRKRQKMILMSNGRRLVAMENSLAGTSGKCWKVKSRLHEAMETFSV